MDKSMIEKKNELMEWIENLENEETLQKILDLKYSSESSSLISDINSELPIINDFDEQFAAGMTSDELLENVAAHIKSVSDENS